MAQVSILPEDYDTLKIEYLSLKKQLDNVNQELYDCKRQLKTMGALQMDYQSEIDMLQSDQIRQKQKYQETILNLEEQINKMRSTHSEQILTLETDLMKMEEKYESLESEVDVLRKSNTDMSFGGDTSKLIEEILSLKEENNGFNENHQELLTNLKDFQEKNTELQRSLVEYKEEISNLKESLDCKRDELAEKNILIQQLNDEVFCLKSELESHKSKPLDEKSKGNSLFAEVNDRRVYLQDTINKMKVEYIAMKQERAINSNTIHQLKLEIARLLNRWKTEKTEKEDDEYEVVNSLQDRIKVLEDTIARCNKELASKPVVMYKNNFEEIHQYYEVVLKKKNKEIKELEEQISSRTVSRILMSTALKKANEEKRRWQLEATMKQEQLELRDMEGKIESKCAQDTDIDSCQKSERPTSALKQKSEDNLEREREDKNETISNMSDDCKVSDIEKRPSALKLTKDSKEIEIEDENRRSNVTIRRSESDYCGKSSQEKRMSALKKIKEEHIHSIEDEIQDLGKKISNITLRRSESESCRKSNQEKRTSTLKEIREINLLGNNEATASIEPNKNVNDTKTQEIIVIEDNDEDIDGCAKGLDKENCPGTRTQHPIEKIKPQKKATFSEDTVSPKKTTTGSRTCRRIIRTNPVFFTTDPK
ncbi:unnamed protein product [Phaedon cochleariae]|uniref:Protein Spindly n=1 Tax=Phaedon cochleariae TaxID=80249 RepID=A0A9P0DLR5_PHACE|nr:unnamed protein product [Phaedon cochleariae]